MAKKQIEKKEIEEVKIEVIKIENPIDMDLTVKKMKEYRELKEKIRNKVYKKIKSNK